MKNSYNLAPSVSYRQGDSLVVLDNLEINFFDLIITSPPYNLEKDYESKLTFDNYLDEQRKIIDKLIPLLTERGSICWQVGNTIDPKTKEIVPLDIFFYHIFKSHGLFLRNRIIWTYGHGLHAKKRFSGRYETILWFSKTKDYLFNLDDVRVPSKYPGKRYFKGPKKGELSGNPKGKNPGDVWEILENDWEREVWNIPNVKSNHPEKTIHPCQYPVELVERCILALTNPGSWILDPFAGVGSTLIAAYQNSRNAIGVELFEEYISIGEQRLDLLRKGQLNLRPLTKGVLDPSESPLSIVPEEFKKVIHEDS